MSDSMVRIGPVAVPGVPIADKAAQAIELSAKGIR